MACEFPDCEGGVLGTYCKTACYVKLTRDDIIRMAREAGCEETWGADAFRFGEVELERFAALVAAAEREACAKVALAADDQGSVNQRLMQKRIAAAIRARGNT